MFIERNTAPAYNNKYYVKTTYGGYNRCIAIDSTGSVLPNCTGYAFGRFMECAGVQECNLAVSNATNWYGYNDGYERGALPKRGAVLCYSGGWESRGHVAFVEEVYSDNSILISQSNYGGTKWEQIRLNAPSYVQGSGLKFQGFIYNPYVEDSPSNIKMHGCDVSKWNSLNTDLSRFDYVIIRATWGTNKDETADAWRIKCEQAGIPYGVYCYSYALDDIGAKEEADYICEVIKDWNIQIGVWYDMETDSYKNEHGFTTPEQWTSACDTFCKRVQEYGYYTGIYASQSYFNSHIHTTDWDRWVASWGSNDGTIQRDTSSMGTMLQYTSKDKDNIEIYYDENGVPHEQMVGLDKDVSYVDLDHYRSYPAHAVVPVPDKPEPTPVPVPEPEPVVVPEPAEPEPGSVFDMPNWLYDLLKFVASILLPLLTTLYVALADTWHWGFTKEIVATITAIITFVNGLLAYSSIEYSKRKG